MDKCCLVIYQASELTDSVTVAMSQVLNLRLSAVTEGAVLDTRHDSCQHHKQQEWQRILSV